MEKALWGKRIAGKIHAGEKNIDEAVRSLSELVAEIHSAQADMNVSAVSTDPSLAKVIEAMALLQQARTSLTTGHRRLEKLGDSLGIRAIGPIVKPSAEYSEDVAPAAERAVA